jgi:AraC-like DNA-binding protein
MQRASLEELGRDPVGRYTAGETFAHFCVHPGLWGLLLWGRPDEAHAREIGRSLQIALSPPAQPHVSIVDATRLEIGRESAFAALERFVTRNGPLLPQWVRKLAIVRAKGLAGAMIAGAQDVLHLSSPVAVFDDAQVAAQWLGENPTELIATLAEIYAEASGTPPFLGALRAVLDENLRDVTVAVAAKKLAMSDRSLQRKLGEAATTFQREVIDARVRAAKRLLLDRDLPLTTIALESGCASLQHFNTLFRKRTGELPSAWREKHGKADGEAR